MEIGRVFDKWANGQVIDEVLIATMNSLAFSKRQASSVGLKLDEEYRLHL